MATDKIEFASLLCSRLCHDLMSPVGAFANGLELLADETDPAMRERCLQLLDQSAQTSANRLKYFRLAFGAAGGFGAEIPASDIHEAIAAIAGERVQVEWLMEAQAIPKDAAKLLLNLALIAVDAMVRGGELAVAYERGAESDEIVVRATGQRIVIDPAIRGALDGTLAPEELGSRTVAAWMTREIATQNGGGLFLSLEDDAMLVLGATLRRAG